MLKRLVPGKPASGERRVTTLPALAALALGLALVVLGAYSAVRPAAGQESFPEPDEIVSENGVLQAKLTAAGAADRDSRYACRRPGLQRVVCRSDVAPESGR